MKLREKKFICDLSSILFAAGVLGSAALLFWDLENYVHMMPLVFSFGALLLLTLSIRSYLVKRRGGIWFCSILAGVLLVFCVISVIFPGGR